MSVGPEPPNGELMIDSTGHATDDVLAADRDPAVAALIAAQDGMVSREQVDAAGITQAALRSRFSRGHWHAVLRGVYATFRGPLTPHQRVVAASLYAGPEAQVTGSAALWLQGWRPCLSHGPVHLLVPHLRQKRDAGWVRLQRTRRLDAHPNAIGALVVVSLPRAVIDAARACTTEESVRQILVSAPWSCTLAELADELEAGPRQHSALIRRALQHLLDYDRERDERAADEASDRD
jgi:hypothetical protein